MNQNQNIVYIETYGCAANQNNSEILAGILSRAGFIATNNQNLANIIILNTCIVKSKTESKIIRRILDISKETPEKILIVAGCMPETNAKNIKNLAPNTILLGTHHFKDILKLIRDFQEKRLDWKKQESYLNNTPEVKLNLPKKPLNNLISIHQISEGCLGDCSYCKTRFAKGKLYSYPQEEILKSIESDLQQGAREIWLTSQDCASYGLDRGESELIELLKKILALKHKFKLRLGMMNPNNVLPIIEELIEIYKDKKMYKFLHSPIQSASDSVLKNMNRKYKIKQAEEIISKFRKTFPEAVIATDIIVGYPTETLEDNKKNLGFIQRFKPDVLNLSKFSSHKGTEAGKLKVLPIETINERAGELMLAHRKEAKSRKEEYFGKTTKVFVNKRISEGFCEARDENYNIILLKCGKEMLGREASVKIKEIGVHHIMGELTSLL